jgi:hypothetical protein
MELNVMLSLESLKEEGEALLGQWHGQLLISLHIWRRAYELTPFTGEFVA